jgi:hypothetical protein
VGGFVGLCCFWRCVFFLAGLLLFLPLGYVGLGALRAALQRASNSDLYSRSSGGGGGGGGGPTASVPFPEMLSPQGPGAEAGAGAGAGYSIPVPVEGALTLPADPLAQMAGSVLLVLLHNRR